MGIRQLQLFIRKYVPTGYLDVSLIDECEEFSRENETRPILLIDLHGLMRPLVKDQEEIFCGIRHNVVNEKADKFLKKMSKIADLIFFNDGPIFDSKLPEWMKRQNEQFVKSQIMITKKIDKKIPLKRIIAGESELMSPTSHLKIIEILAQKYGMLKTAMNRECGAEMSQFASQNQRVLGILADDSDFLVYPGNWKYFSLRDLNQTTLITKEYNRKALREFLSLNDQELVLLSTLNGNDVISFEKDTFCFHKSLIQQRNNPKIRFPAIANYIRSHRLFGNDNVAVEVAYAIYRHRSEYTSNKNKFVKKVQDSIDFYDIDFEIPEIKDDTQYFCSENSLIFALSILKLMPFTFTLNYFDQERPANYFESVNSMFSKQLGIILNDKSVEQYKIYSKLSYNDPEYSIIEVDKSTPNILIPPLIELLDRSEFPKHDRIRFKLLKWLISEENLHSVNLKSVPENILKDILVLVYMVNEGFIDVKEADIILLSIKHVRDGCVLKNLKAPEILHPRAFYASILFSKCHIYVARSLEVTGLKDFEKIHNFDGVLFHYLFLEHIDEDFDQAMLLGNLAEYRYYA
ncbi:uncharacterized protein [Chironomus tepperi]|uniref:uncharacterized protein n=1 Tax=Chironomus tepperi TaxID=113505 RepID=UPI00391F6E14